MCTVNKSVHTKKVWKLIECTSYLTCELCFLRNKMRFSIAFANCAFKTQLEELASKSLFCTHLGLKWTK